MDFSPLVSLNKALLGDCFLGGVALGGGTLNSHDNDTQFDPLNNTLATFLESNTSANNLQSSDYVWFL